MADQSSKLLAIIMWVLSFFFWFIPSLLFVLLKKDDKFVYGHAKEALNWEIIITIVGIIGLILSAVGIGFIILWLAWLCNIIVVIVGLIKSASGDSFSVPFVPKLIK